MRDPVRPCVGNLPIIEWEAAERKESVRNAFYKQRHTPVNEKELSKNGEKYHSLMEIERNLRMMTVWLTSSATDTKAAI